VLARVGGAEGEFPLCVAPVRDDAVVVIEGFFHRYEDADVGFGEVGFCAVVPECGFVVAWGVLSVWFILLYIPLYPNI
jgi:hypothetical protein